MLVRRAQFHQGVLVSHATAAHPAYRSLMERSAHRFLAHGSSPADAARQAQALVYASIQLEASVKAFIDDFWLLGVIFFGMIPVVLFMRTTVHGRHTFTE